MVHGGSWWLMVVHGGYMYIYIYIYIYVCGYIMVANVGSWLLFIMVAYGGSWWLYNGATLWKTNRTMEHQRAMNGKTHSKWPCSIAMLNHQRVL